MNNCPNCGWDLSEKVGTQRDSYHTAIERAKIRLMKEIGFGIANDTYKRNNKTITNNKKIEGDTE